MYSAEISEHLRKILDYQTFARFFMNLDNLISPLLVGRRPNGFLGLSLNDGTILFLVISLDKTVSVG